LKPNDILLQSPIFAALPLPVQRTAGKDISRLLSVGEEMRQRLKGSSSDASIDTRVYGYYLPVFVWLEHALLSHGIENRGEARALVVGLSAPQGCGKTTLVNQLKSAFVSQGLTCVTLSLDDFYLTNAEQTALARRFQDNPLLQYRGNAGTHDLDLCIRTLARLLELKRGEQVAVPSYDKALCGGRGDRAPVEAWSTVTGKRILGASDVRVLCLDNTAGPVDVLLFEGWMLGFQAAAQAELGNVIRVYPQLQVRSLFCAASMSVPCCVFLSNHHHLAMCLLVVCALLTKRYCSNLEGSQFVPSIV
jgi:D-glycerate 3-kinase